MKNQTSTKNIVIGFTLGLIVTLSLGAALKNNNEVSRFQIAAGDHNAYVVDTVTGQVWSTIDGYKAFRDPKAEPKGF